MMLKALWVHSGVAAFILIVVGSGAAMAGGEFVFPPNAGVLNVLDFGAVPDDGKDDTAAIQKALDAFPAGHCIIYLPNGVYRIMDTLHWPQGVNQGQYMKYTTLQGQSTEGVVLQLPDATAGFTDAKNPKAMVFTGSGPAQRFGNEVRNLTIHTGKGNAGATGLQFNASNYGCMRHVRIISGDGAGAIGLDMAFTGEIGPLLVKDLYVQGFDYGIKTQENEASQTFEHIRLENQNRCGIYNKHQNIFILGLDSTNAAPAVWNDTHSGLVSLIDARLVGVGEAGEQPAVIHGHQTTTFVRNLVTQGYKMAIRNDAEGGADVLGPAVAEWSSSGAGGLFSSPRRSLNLPVKETPDVPLDSDLDNWADPRAFGAVPGDAEDDTAALQEAIDSGKATVYLPAGGTGGEGQFIVNGTLRIRGNVSRIIGFSGRINGSGTILFEDGAAPVVIAERVAFGFFGNIRVEVATKRTVVLKDCSVDRGIVHTGSGELFLENMVSGGRLVFKGGPVYARQVNPEVPGVHILVDGAQAWFHGMKVEVKGTILEARNNAVVEHLGLFVYSSHRLDRSPMIVIDNSRLSITVREKTNFGQPYPVIVQETRGKETRLLPNPTDVGARLGLYCGYPIDKPTTPAAPSDLTAKGVSPSEIVLSWSDNSSDEDGFRLERRKAGADQWEKVADVGVDQGQYTDTGLSFATAYEYRVRAYNPAGESGPTAVAEASTAPNTAPPEAPANLAASTPSDGRVVLMWKDKSNNEEAFKIHRKTGRANWAEIAAVQPNATSHVDSNVKPGTRYSYRLQAANSIGASEPTASVDISTLPEGWSMADIGNPTREGTTTYSVADGMFLLASGGADIWGESDQFHLCSREATGNVQIVARVTRFTDAGYYGKAAVMIRDNLGPNAAFAYVAARPDNWANFICRKAAGQAAFNTQLWAGGGDIKWLKVTRVGNIFRGFYSAAEQPSEKDWVELGAKGGQTISMGGSVRVGLAVATGGAEGNLSTATFAGMSVSDKVELPALGRDGPLQRPACRVSMLWRSPAGAMKGAGFGGARCPPRRVKSHPAPGCLRRD